MDKVSVIVPIYNVEKYLDRCVESIVDQSYEELEIILVDDGSPDNCPGMCDDWAKKDSRIKVIHKENSGPSSARNVGLDNMTGDYVYFIDSDDYINEKAIETLYELLKQHDADMSYGRFYRVFENETNYYQPVFSNKISVYNEDTFWKMLYSLYGTKEVEYAVNMIVPWNKLIKSSVFDGLRFDIDKYYEDERIIHKIIHECKKIVFTDTRLYEYINNPNGRMSSFSEKHFIDTLEAFSERTVFFADINKPYTYQAYKHFYWVFREKYFEISDLQYKKQAKRIFKDTYKKARSYLKCGSRKEIILCDAFYLSDNLFKITDNFFIFFSKLKRLFK